MLIDFLNLLTIFFALSVTNVHNIPNNITNDVNHNLKSISTILMEIKKNTSDNTNNYIQIILTSVTIVASISISRWIIIYQEKRSRKKIIIDSCDSLIEEIGDINAALPISDTENAITILINKDPTPIEKYFPVDSYDSIIHSAHYLQLNKRSKK